MNNNYLIGLVVIVVLAGAGIWYWNTQYTKLTLSQMQSQITGKWQFVQGFAECGGDSGGDVDITDYHTDGTYTDTVNGKISESGTWALMSSAGTNQPPDTILMKMVGAEGAFDLAVSIDADGNLVLSQVQLDGGEYGACTTLYKRVK